MKARTGLTLPPFVVRDASEADNASLSDFARTFPVEGGVRWSIDRGPDFFAPFRAEADGWHLVVAEEEESGRTVGYVSVAVRTAYLEGRARPTCYVSHLFVRPECRGRGIGDALCWRAAELCRQSGGDEVPILAAIREGNAHMRGRLSGPRGLPGLLRFAGLHVHSVRTRVAPTLRTSSSVEIRPANTVDLEEMAGLSRRVSRQRQFAPSFDAASLGRWVAGAPGLTLSDYRVARERGQIVGYLGLWDEAAIRVVRIAGYSRRVALRYALYNVRARITGARLMPRVGDTLGCSRTVHVCVPAHRPDVLRTLLIRAAAELRARGYWWLKIALDECDPLARALAGLKTRATNQLNS